MRTVNAILSTGPVLQIQIPTRLRIGGVVVAVVARTLVAREPEARTQEVDVDKGSQVRGLRCTAILKVGIAGGQLHDGDV